MMHIARFLALVSIFAIWQTQGPPRLGPVERLQAKIRVEAIRNDPSHFAGRYTSASKELGDRVGGFLSGENLYLFPDGTYIYCEWTDIMPETVFDKGAWKLEGGTVRLTSDSEIKWAVNLDRGLAPVRRLNHEEEIILVGIERELSYFEKEAGDDPELMLLIVGLVRFEGLDKVRTDKIKAKLMKDAWRPEFFKD